MKTGQKIKEFRIKKGMTQNELAKKSKVSTTTIEQIENGETYPGTHTLQMIAKALDVDYYILLNIESDTEKEYIKDTDKVLTNDDDRYWLALLHLSAILPLFFPAIILYNQKKDEIKEMRDHFHAVITFQFTILFACILGLWAFVWAHNPHAIRGFLILGGIFSIMNALRVLNNQSYKYFYFFKLNR